MIVELPEAEALRLAEHAKNAGFDDVSEFAAAHLLALAHKPTKDEEPPLTEEELRHLAALCDRGMEDVRAGRTMSVEEARRRSLERLEQRRHEKLSS